MVSKLVFRFRNPVSCELVLARGIQLCNMNLHVRDGSSGLHSLVVKSFKVS